MKNTPIYGWPYPEPGDHTRTWEYWQNLATAIDNTLSTQITGPIVTFTPTWTGLTLGNGVSYMKYRQIGGHIHVFIQIGAASSGVTTAFTTADCTFTIPFQPLARTTGVVYFESGTIRAGMVTSMGSPAIRILALKQSDVTYNPPGTVWGTSPWPVGSWLFGSFLVPI